MEFVSWNANVVSCDFDTYGYKFPLKSQPLYTGITFTKKSSGGYSNISITPNKSGKYGYTRRCKWWWRGMARSATCWTEYYQGDSYPKARWDSLEQQVLLCLTHHSSPGCSLALCSAVPRWSRLGLASIWLGKACRYCWCSRAHCLILYADIGCRSTN